MQKFTGTLIALVMLCACNTGPVTDNNSSDSLQNKKDTAAHNTVQPEVIESGQHAITDKVTMQTLHLLGKEVNCTYSQIPEQLKQQLPLIMQSISENKAVITGSYHIALLENPSDSKPCRVFIGIPLQKPIWIKSMQNLDIPAGQYLRHQLNTEPGKSLSTHQSLLQMPFKKLKKQIGFPILEKYAETRNEEMTSVISKATFYYTLLH